MQLLVQIIPMVARESCFALKGGTAINLFIRDLPRLSVDIDLAYLPLDPRSLSDLRLFRPKFQKERPNYSMNSIK
ncbi:MAG: nucleotidyl transferase AbiEii/AbiGii toxin family protein [Endozoicomonas sp.]|uniref:nucleotidyl transferase AbiEii/AbiGii toxin family protein n=1 Tax=Endozoicomonas sp. TaxID=1892382 RepID=UPI003D9B97AD